jgi:hypothetical protein
VTGTLTQFSPTAVAPFQFQATLTNAVATPNNSFVGTATYNCTVVWNTFGQRWYLQVIDQNGNLIVQKPMVASPPGYNISLIGGYFSGSTLVFLEATGQFLVNP